MDPKTVSQNPSAPVPGMSAGEKNPSPVAPGNPPGAISGLPPDKDAAAKSVVSHGGNKGGRPRNDGLVPGSVEAIEADRKKDAERKQRERARNREQREAVRIPSPLPSAAAVAAAGVAGSVQTQAESPSPSLAPAIGAWVPEDFNFVVADTIQIAEAWRVKRGTDKAIKGNLPHAIAAEIGRGFAFPDESKNSLRASSPAGFAKLFNALNVPLTFKPVVSACPAVAYLIVRDSQLDAKLDKLIADEAERRKSNEKKP